MSLYSEDEKEEAERARRAAAEHTDLLHRTAGASISIGNEFAEVRLVKIETRNGSRLLIESPASGQSVTLCPLELEALTWQDPATFSAMVGNPFGSLIDASEDG